MRKKVGECVAQFTAGYTLDEDCQDRQDRSHQQDEDPPEPYVWDRDYSQVTRPQLRIGTIRFGH